jgi:hypothetical protein
LIGRFKPWLAFPLLAAIVIAGAWAIHAYRYRLVRSDRDLVALLPQSAQTTTFFANVAALRSARMLDLLAGAGDQEYKTFVSSTGFDFARDLDSLAGSTDGKQMWFIARGRFEQHQVEGYVRQHGGKCQRGICEMSGATPGMWASFRFVQPDVIALNVGPNRGVTLRPVPGRGESPGIPSDPVWVQVSMELLKDPRPVPAALRIFAIALQPADAVLLALNRSAEPNAAFEIGLRGTCANAATARTVKQQLQILTEMLKLELAREHQRPNPADLTGLLTGGVFRESGKEVVGTWAVSPAFLTSLH